MLAGKLAAWTASGGVLCDQGIEGEYAEEVRRVMI